MICTCGHDVRAHNLLGDGPEGPGQCGQRGCDCRAFAMVDDFYERLASNREEHENDHRHEQSPVYRWVFSSDPWLYWKWMDHPMIGRDRAIDTLLAESLCRDAWDLDIAAVWMHGPRGEDDWAIVEHTGKPADRPWRLTFPHDTLGTTERHYQTMAAAVSAAERDGAWQQRWIERQPLEIASNVDGAP